MLLRSLLVLLAALLSVIGGSTEAGPFRLPELYVQLKGRETADDFARIRAAGFKGVRIGIRWDLVERERNRRDFAYLLEALRASERAGLGLLVTIRGGNPLYGEVVDHYTPSVRRVERLARAPSTRLERAGFLAFATAAVSAARAERPSVPVTWEIWNEPDFSRFWPPRPDPPSLATLVAETCRAMREAGAARIVGPALGERDSVLGPATFLHALQDAGALDCLDALSVHPYWARPPETWLRDAATLREAVLRIASSDRELPLVITEWGFTNLDGAPGEGPRAERLVRAVLAAGRSGIGSMSVYEWRDSGTDPADPQHHYGLNTPDGSPKLALDAVRWLLDLAARTTLTARPLERPPGWQVEASDGAGTYQLLSWQAEATPIPTPDAVDCSPAAELIDMIGHGPGAAPGPTDRAARHDALVVTACTPRAATGPRGDR